MAGSTADFRFKDYVELLKWTADIKKTKVKYLKKSAPELLTSLGFSLSDWHELTNDFEKLFRTFVGGENLVARICRKNNLKNYYCINPCRRLFGT